MFDFRDSCHFFRRAVVCFSLLALAALPALTQTVTNSPALLPPNTPEFLDELNQGVRAFKSAHYDEAIAHFRRATELNPASVTAKIYLGTALAENVVPGVIAPENLRTAQQAIDVFEKVLEANPHDVTSMKQIAAVSFAIGEMSEARAWQMKVLGEDPTDAEAAYTIGVIDWREAHQNALKALSSAGLNDDGRGNADAPAEVMTAIAAQNRALVKEGLKYLTQAIEDRPDYSDAMAYLNLLYRRKADFDRDNESALAEDLSQAKNWTNKAMATRKANEEKKGESGEPGPP